MTIPAQRRNPKISTQFYRVVLAGCPTQPNVTFDRRMVVDLGGRKVEISFLGRGNTAGDAVVYVPDAKVLATGDLLDAPIPYAMGSFIGEWIVTMKALAAYDAAVMVPGHGTIEHDKQYMLLVIQASNRCHSMHTQR